MLGPILFLIYINDICNVSDSLQYVLFADDTNIFCSEKKLVDLQVILNRELSKLYVWFSVNKLSLNLDKTNYILFQNRPPDNSLNLHINNINVPQVQSTKFLGIIIDEQINWKPQILAVRCKLSKTVSIMYKASKLINPEGMFTLYHSLVMPYLLSQIDITVYLVYYLVLVFIVSFDNVIYTCCHLVITSVFSRAALPIMGNKQLHVKWPRALLRFISVRLENPNKIAIAILSSTFWCRNPGLFIP